MRLCAKPLRGPAGRIVAGVIAEGQIHAETIAAFVEGYLTPRRREVSVIRQRGIASGQSRADLDIATVRSALDSPVHVRVLPREPIDDAWVGRLCDTVLPGCQPSHGDRAVVTLHRSRDDAISVGAIGPRTSMQETRTTHPMARLAAGAAYGATQLPRLAWYIGHGIAMQQLASAARRRAGASARPRARTDKPVPDRRRLFADMADLLRRDVENVAAGLYPLPIDNEGSSRVLLERSRLFFSDLPSIHARRESGTTNDVLESPLTGKRPRYYLQNFHYQTGGWLTEESAERYDTQVEVMFKGTANAMRRQALPALAEILARRDQSQLKLLDVGCGTGRFLDSVRQAWPRLQVAGLDFSEAYTRAAKSFLGRGARADVMVANAEHLPFADGSFDATTSVFMFHELPPTVRRRVFAEFARVLKPGGRLVIVDSLQTGDVPEYDGSLELFPQNFHEPYFTSYIREDFPAIAASVGLSHRRDTTAFVSKVMVFDRVGAAA